MSVRKEKSMKKKILSIFLVLAIAAGTQFVYAFAVNSDVNDVNVTDADVETAHSDGKFAGITEWPIYLDSGVYIVPWSPDDPEHDEEPLRLLPPEDETAHLEAILAEIPERWLLDSDSEVYIVPWSPDDPEHDEEPLHLLPPEDETARSSSNRVWYHNVTFRFANGAVVASNVSIDVTFNSHGGIQTIHNASTAFNNAGWFYINEADLRGPAKNARITGGAVPDINLTYFYATVDVALGSNHANAGTYVARSGTAVV